ncbi:MAG: endonuclease MutS2 [Candidatus Tectomicrobia bacterium]|uniref:Endonuclease MutS2 n=1 Tax=Tectimicrobiota bacterium TaxID=2528274 RepID=A0A938B3I0_UNCTE|nr:endonuclease MutS2 [Candidatus Tectomicrobia bacterium]
MNDHTEAVLDYPLIRNALQAYAVTPMGKTLVAQLHPQADAERLGVHLQETSELAAALALGADPPLAPVEDIHEHLAAVHISGFYLEGTQFLEVAQCLEVLQRLRRYGQLESQRLPLLSHRLARLSDFSILLREIRTALDDKGAVRDHASPALQEIRQRLKRVRDRVHRRLHDLMGTYSSVVQDAVVTIRNERFVIPLKTDFRQALRGIVHGESASGATVYVEPDSVVELNNELLHVQAEEEREVRQILRQLTERLAVQSVALEQALELLGEVDFIVAKGRLSQSMRGVAPQFVSQPTLRLLGARHPLLAEAVPIDVVLGPADRTLVITGPNTGGKTAALKTLGLLVLMAQSGLHIPARADSALPRFTEVFVDVGDEQSLQQSLSTFSAHLANICTMMQQVSPQALVLLDELGAGTDPMEGGPLGVAILEHFHTSGAMTVATTHHSAIKAYATATPQVACAAVDFDLDTLQPRYQLLYGLPGRSKAFTIAQKLGLPAQVIARAEQEAGLTQLRSEQLLARLEVERQVLATQLQDIESTRTDTERMHAAAQQTLAEAGAEEQRIRHAFYQEGQLLLKTARQDLDATLAAVRQQAPPGAVIAFPQEAWRRIVQNVETLAPAVAATPPAPLPLQVGDQVRVRGMNIIGRLRTPSTGSGNVQVDVGGKTITVAAAALERAEAQGASVVAEPASRPIRTRRRTAVTEGVSAELGLLGATIDEALPAVEKYLDQAFAEGLGRVHLIHGVGSGRLRQAITALLEHHPLVRRFQAGDASGGTTLVELEG